MTKKRPNRATIAALIAASGKPCTITEDAAIVRMDGTVIAMTKAEYTGMMHVNPEMLGWTKAELEDPTITE